MLKMSGLKAQSCASFQHLNHLEIHCLKLGVPLASLKMGSSCCLRSSPFLLLPGHCGGHCLCVSAVLTISRQLPGSCLLLYFTLSLVFTGEKGVRKPLSAKRPSAGGAGTALWVGPKPSSLPPQSAGAGGSSGAGTNTGRRGC